MHLHLVRIGLLAMLGWGLSAPCAAASDRDRALTGALTGAALGALIGENSGSIDTEIAIPAFAILGGLTGYYSSDLNHDRYYYDYRPHRYYNSMYNDRYYYDYGSRRYYNRRHRHHPGRYVDLPPPAYRPSVQAPVRKPRETAQTQHPQRNLQPGVEIVRVAYSWPNGHTRTMRLLKMNNRYVGPQGETYATLPTAEELSARYAPSAN